MSAFQLFEISAGIVFGNSFRGLFQEFLADPELIIFLQE
jgi:hypothetical protein